MGVKKEKPHGFPVLLVPADRATEPDGVREHVPVSPPCTRQRQKTGRKAVPVPC